MFYSHTFLAKKGPLGTVWIAAHLQHKLRKSHVAPTNISSTVDCIMFPEVPIALRLSGHLLLGVVRIFSKKVDYLFHDCHEVLSRMGRMFTSVHVNSPEDADRPAPPVVTLPRTFELDAMELDTSYQQETPDNHLKTLDQITLTDQIPVEGDPCVVAVTSEDRFDSFPQTELPGPPDGPVVDEIHPQPPGVNDHAEHIASGANSVEGLPQSTNADQVFADLSPIEIMRDAQHDFGLERVGIPDMGILENSIEPDTSTDHSRNKRMHLSPTALPISEEPLPSLRHEKTPAVASLSLGASERLNTGISPGGQSLNMELRLSSPVKQQNAIPRRKRRMYFDKSVVLTNVEMRGQLEDTTNIVHKRRKCPSSTLDVWKSQKYKQKYQMFDGPLISGMCIKLQEVSEKVFPAMTSVSSHPIHEMDVEIEQAMFNIHDQDLPSPVPPFRRELTPVDTTISINSLGSMGKITPDLPILEILPSIERVDHRTATSPVEFEEPLNSEMRVLPEVPSLLDCPEEDLSFLEAENTPSPSDQVTLSVGYESRKCDSMSTRTRSVAQYFKEQSPMTQFTNDQSGSLSLNKVLEGKRRKQCARMFFETLVLKTHDLIDVEQKEPYGDISIFATPALSKLAM